MHFLFFIESRGKNVFFKTYAKVLSRFDLAKLNGFAQGNAASTEETSAMAEELADMVHSSTETIQNLNVHVQNLIENVSKL